MNDLFVQRYGCRKILSGIAAGLFIASITAAIAGATSVSAQTALHRLSQDAVSSQIGIDYTPEARCSDNNWSTATPVACNP
ncbi:hypothetical protein QEV83_16020 [Methylocapsa sp. D3K7]|uniref:hypothetical protein n=1 Tax=Methylocapsa sp. D3K7 TaxID=3041435 RepID=UPI00244F00F5|nr:hypothetical protein [Methylocapsa sp. D3K7]WGJ14140.1 hypothetical protein QEV83_16020 [Methylocapsa sp. D3K7]